MALLKPCRASLMKFIYEISQGSKVVNPLNANPIKWLNTFKQFVDKLLTNCLSVFGHFLNLALKGLTIFGKEFH